MPHLARLEPPGLAFNPTQLGKPKESASLIGIAERIRYSAPWIYVVNRALNDVSLIIELRVALKAIDGLQTSWHDMDVRLGGRRHEFPLLARIDPYDDLTYAGPQIVDLAAEIRTLLEDPRGTSLPLMNNLLRLCDLAITHSKADLNFVGD